MLVQQEVAKTEIHLFLACLGIRRVVNELSSSMTRFTTPKKTWFLHHTLCHWPDSGYWELYANIQGLSRGVTPTVSSWKSLKTNPCSRCCAMVGCICPLDGGGFSLGAGASCVFCGFSSVPGSLGGGGFGFGFGFSVDICGFFLWLRWMYCLWNVKRKVETVLYVCSDSEAVVGVGGSPPALGLPHTLRPRSHTTLNTSRSMYGTHCIQWECSHSLQASKGFAHKFLWKSASACSVNGTQECRVDGGACLRKKGVRCKAHFSACRHQDKKSDFGAKWPPTWKDTNTDLQISAHTDHNLEKAEKDKTKETWRAFCFCTLTSGVRYRCFHFNRYRYPHLL